MGGPRLVYPQHREAAMDERMKNFRLALESIFEQYEKLWKDNLNLLEKIEESGSSFSGAQAQLQKGSRDGNVLCPETVRTEKNQGLSDDVTYAAGNVGKVQEEIETEKVSERSEVPPDPVDEDVNPDIYPEDFSVDLFEHDLSQGYQTPPEGVDDTGLIKRSPVLGGRNSFSKTRKTNSCSSSFGSEGPVAGPDNSVEVCTPVTNEILSGQSSKNNQSDKRFSLKLNVRELDFETTYNGKTVFSASKNKKLMQSELPFKPVGNRTDARLLDFDDYFNASGINDSIFEDDRRSSQGKKKNKIKKTNAEAVHSAPVKTIVERTNTSFPEDDVIQASPMQETSLSKIRNKLNSKGRNASAGSIGSSSDPLEIILKDKGNNFTDTANIVGCDIDTDADTTLFISKGKSTVPSSTPPTLPTMKSSVPKNNESRKNKTDLNEAYSGIVHNENTDTNNILCVRNKNSTERSVLSKEKFKGPCVESPVKKKFKSLKRDEIPPRTPEEEYSQRNDTAGCTKGDETYFSQAEMHVEWLDDSGDDAATHLKESPDRQETKSLPRRRLLANDSFDIVPRKKPPSPNFAYKGSPVRKKAERAKLKGWACWECKEWYEGLDLDKEQLQARKDRCSRHRAKYDERQSTPRGFWNPDFPDTQVTQVLPSTDRTVDIVTLSDNDLSAIDNI